jgi:DegV family protein with EDD domain
MQINSAISHSEKKSNIAIITDSVAQVPTELARELNISIVPMGVQINGKIYLDNLELDLAELYRRMRTEKITPTTTAPSAGEFKEVMNASLGAGAEAVLCITLSSKLSSSFNNACLAADLIREEKPGSNIQILDSLKAAASQGYMVIGAARAAARHESIEEILQEVHRIRSRTSLVASLDTLEYLARGGRIGKVAYRMGSMINIKPVITLDEDGTISPIAKVRSTQHALQVMVDHVSKKVKGCSRLYLTILEADAPRQASIFYEMIREQLQPLEIQKSVFTPVMGVHTGPGLIGLVYYYE